MAATVASPVHQLGVVDGVRRQVDYWSVVYQRTWRATVVSSFLAPLLYVVAMGVLLGGFIDADPEVLEGATSYFDFVVPGLIAAHAMQTAVGETTFPVMGMIKWQRIYDSISAEAWRQWIEHSKKLVNEYRLDLTQKKAHDVLKEQCEQFLFGDGGMLPPEYVPEGTKPDKH